MLLDALKKIYLPLKLYKMKFAPDLMSR